MDVPEDRARTVRMCKRLGIWPLDAKHKDGACACERCFAGDSSALVADELAVRRRRVALPWEDDYQAA